MEAQLLDLKVVLGCVTFLWITLLTAFGRRLAALMQAGVFQ
jgi:hypothetical protein